jgi:hypothetical protein
MKLYTNTHNFAFFSVLSSRSTNSNGIKAPNNAGINDMGCQLTINRRELSKENAMIRRCFFRFMQMP